MILLFKNLNNLVCFLSRSKEIESEFCDLEGKSILKVEDILKKKTALPN